MTCGTGLPHIFLQQEPQQDGHWEEMLVLRPLQCCLFRNLGVQCQRIKSTPLLTVILCEFGIPLPSARSKACGEVSCGLLTPVDTKKDEQTHKARGPGMIEHPQLWLPTVASDAGEWKRNPGSPEKGSLGPQCQRASRLIFTMLYVPAPSQLFFISHQEHLLLIVCPSSAWGLPNQALLCRQG